jgi:RIO kinase 1
MTKINLNGFDLEAYDDIPKRVTKVKRKDQRQSERHDHQVSAEIAAAGALAEQGETEVFNPTFSSSRYEREWILNYLGEFYQDHHITDVLHQVKGGKEATVYCCAAHPSTGLELLAAKIYRPQAFRAMRNDARYREGRAVLDQDGVLVKDERALHALAKKTRFGREVAHTTWIEYEYQALTRLHAAGADVPRPIARGNNTILMEYLGDVEEPAPPLSRVVLRHDEAHQMFARLLEDIELMLALRIVHGDLSAYNILYWEGRFKIIDFPQIVDPDNNRDAYAIFARDVERVCQHFARYRVASAPAQLARELWARHGYAYGPAIPKDYDGEL